MRVEGKKRFRSANEYSIQKNIVADPSGNQGSAIQLVKEINIITGASTVGDSVKLPSCIEGLRITVKNSTTSSITVYPYESNSIDDFSLDSGITLGLDKVLNFYGKDNTTFETDKFILSTSEGGGVSVHNNLTGLQGGTTNQYYHLTQAEESNLTSGGNASTYHIHDDRYYKSGDNAEFQQVSASSGTLILKGEGGLAGNIELSSTGGVRIDADSAFFRSRDASEEFGLFNSNGLTLSSLAGADGQIVTVNANGLLELSGSTIADVQSGGGVSVHSDLTGLQGGTTNEYFHLTQSQHSILTTGGDADSLHSHLSGRAVAGTLSTWSSIGNDVYQEDFSHIYSTKDLFVETRNAITNDIVIPHKITFPDNNTIRVQVRDNTLSVRLVLSPSASGSGGGGVTVHNDLDTIQGGTTNEYYHLTQVEESSLTSGTNADAYHIHSQPFIEQTINEQTGTAYTLADTDHGKLVSLDNAASIVLYVDGTLRTNFGCAVLQRGAGQVTFSSIGTASIVTPDGFFTSEKRYVTCSIQHLSSSLTFLLDGRLV